MTNFKRIYFGKFKKLIFLDVIIGELQLKEAVVFNVAELKKIMGQPDC